MDYHGLIMNLRADIPPDVAEATRDVQIGFETGHRDARSAAAEIAAEADARIAELEAELKEYPAALQGYRTFEETSLQAIARMRAELESARAGKSAALERVAEKQARLDELESYWNQ